MNNKSRLAKLEKKSVTDAKKFYTCCIHDEETNKGYTVNGDGERLHFATRKELDAFGARPDVELLVINIVTASKDEANG